MSPTTPSLRVGFAGTPEFAREALAHILAAGFTVPLVLTQPDRPAGRGMKLQPSAVKQLAVQHGLPVAQPTSLKLDGRWPEEAAAAQQALLDARLDVLVVAAYGLILPRWTLTLPPLGCLNIHGSLLPRWRGAAPIHRAIEAGDAQTGITIMQMDEGLDTGDMLLTATEPILAHDTTATLHDRLATCGGTLIVQALQALDTSGHLLPATPQPAEGVNYAHKIDKREAALDWTLPAEVLARRIRAFDPFPGAHFSRGADSLKVWQAEVVPANTAAPTPPAPGEVLAVTPKQIVVACGPDHQGQPSALALRALQRPGGRRQPVREFLQACTLRPGERLG